MESGWKARPTPIGSGRIAESTVGAATTIVGTGNRMHLSASARRVTSAGYRGRLSAFGGDTIRGPLQPHRQDPLDARPVGMGRDEPIPRREGAVLRGPPGDTTIPGIGDDGLRRAVIASTGSSALLGLASTSGVQASTFALALALTFGLAAVLALAFGLALAVALPSTADASTIRPAASLLTRSIPC